MWCTVDVVALSTVGTTGEKTFVLTHTHDGSCTATYRFVADSRVPSIQSLQGRKEISKKMSKILMGKICAVQTRAVQGSRMDTLHMVGLCYSERLRTTQTSITGPDGVTSPTPTPRIPARTLRALQQHHTTLRPQSAWLLGGAERDSEP